MYVLPGPKELRDMRLKLGLSQTELARNAGVSQSLIARIESGSVNPRFSTIKRILDALQKEQGTSSLGAGDIMTSPVIHVGPSDSIGHASRLMEQHGISQLPVLEGDVQVGSISEAKIVDTLATIRDRTKVSSKAVSEIMSDGFPTIGPRTDLDTLSKLVGPHNAVLIVEKGRVMGIVTKADLLRLAEE